MAEQRIVCEHCGGSGKPNRVSDIETFIVVEGFIGMRCRYCHGTGYVTLSDAGLKQ